MFKHVLISFLLLSPLLAILVGFPVVEHTNKEGTFALSKRCFVVGNLKQFVSCYKSHEKLRGLLLIQQVVFSLEHIQKGMGYSALFVVAIQVIAIPFIVKEILHE